MNVSQWVVSSKTEGGEGRITVTLRPLAGEPANATTGHVSITMSAVAAAPYEPGTEVTLSLEVA